MFKQNQEVKTIGTVLSENMIVCILGLMAFGFFMVMNASSTDGIFKESPSLLSIKQATWDIFSLFIASFILLAIPLSWIKKSAPWLGILTLVLLAGVLVFGHSSNGATRWFRIGSYSFQPSEMAKITSVIFFSWYLDKKKNKISSWIGMFTCMLLIFLVIGLIALEPDLGSSVLILIALVSMLFVAGARVKHILSLLVFIFPVFCFFMYTRFGHIKNRLDAYLNPEDHFLGAFYQGQQGLIALGSGGLFGKGIGAGLQKIYYLPEAHNDFIFAIIGEDLGFIGCSLVILLYALLVWYAIQACLRTTNLFNLLLSYGIICLFAGQAMFNLSVVTALVPNKGISLPLISYGGSNVLFTMIGLAILVKITQSLPPDKPQELGALQTKPKTKALF